MNYSKAISNGSHPPSNGLYVGYNGNEGASKMNGDDAETFPLPNGDYKPAQNGHGHRMADNEIGNEDIDSNQSSKMFDEYGERDNKEFISLGTIDQGM